MIKGALVFLFLFWGIGGGGTVAKGSQDGRQIDLQPGDHICYIGNGMADRMQHHAWLETYIHAAHPEHDLTMRNLAFAGDEVDFRPRSENFGEPDQWLSKCKADVVFCFFGYNEALRGEEELPEFEADLSAMIDRMLAKKYNGKSAPRIVVFSPIAHENLRSPHLPDGQKNNKNLLAYTHAMKRVCQDKHESVVFVDLFSLSTEIYRDAKSPLTMNGIHLLDAGNRLIARSVMKSLVPNFRLPAIGDKETTRLCNSVLDKNYYWFSRYRVVDGYNVYGGRSKLNWHGQSNFDVMLREMEMFDVMTANRDKRVWAIARGGDLQVLDDNLPAKVEVKTNQPGKLPGGEYLYQGGKEAISKMRIAKGMKVNLFASEEMFPELANPVQMAVDTDSRLFVSVWPSYPHWHPAEPREDKILCLPDEDGDGVADKCVVFADQLNSITGFEFWGGGMLVASPPEIWFLKDTDGDDKADVKIRMLQGLSSADTHHSANAMVIGPDGGLYWSRGVFNVTSMETPTKTFRSTTSGVYRFDPRTFEIDFHFPIGPNPHGDVFDKWGYQFATDGTGGAGSYINIGKGIGNKTWYEERVRPVPATGILSSSHFPEANEGNFLICNAIGFLGVLQHEVKYNGADITAKEIEPILVSSDPNFRPTDLEVGGDGALYVSDWCNALIGHMQHNMRDPNRDHTHGRIYRVTSEGRPLLKPVRLKGKPIETVLDAFFAKENGTRYRARLELSGRETAEVTRQVAAWANGLDATDELQAQALLECLWVFEEHRIANLELLQKVFTAREPRVRAAAIRTLGHWGSKVESWQPTLTAAARDESALVRAEAVKAAVAFPVRLAAEVVFEVANRPTDPELKTVLRYAREQLEIDAILRNAVSSGEKLSPAAREYALQNISVNVLLKMENSEEFLRTILSRSDVREKNLEIAARGLAKSVETTLVDILLQFIQATDRGEIASNVEGLGQVLLKQSTSDLASVRDSLVLQARLSQSATIRQIGYAALVVADGALGELLVHASESKSSFRDLIGSIGLIPSSEIRKSLFVDIRPLQFGLPHDLSIENGAVEFERSGVREVAIEAVQQIPGFHQEKFDDWSSLIISGDQRDRAIQAIRSLPSTDWPIEKIEPLAESLAIYIADTPTNLRTAKNALDAMLLTEQLASRLPEEHGREFLARIADLRVNVIQIGTVPERMIYDKERLVIQAGKPVEFVFSNTDAMPHNFVITMPGAMEEVGLLAESTSMEVDAMNRHYVPKSDKILLSSKLLQPKESQALSFNAPSEHGIYPYVCTYPGHWRRMYGALYVVDDLKAYLADPEGYLVKHPLKMRDELLKFMDRNTPWKYDDLIGPVGRIAPSQEMKQGQEDMKQGGMKMDPMSTHGRSFDVAKNVFKVANCISCHQMNGEGREYGPDLTQLEHKRLEPGTILRSILEPDHEIDDKYQTEKFLLQSGQTIVGLVVAETDEMIKVIIDPLVNPEPTTIDKEEIEARNKATVSSMPKELLNRLTEEEILDLIAYVHTKGSGDHAIFKDGHKHK